MALFSSRSTGIEYECHGTPYFSVGGPAKRTSRLLRSDKVRGPLPSCRIHTAHN